MPNHMRDYVPADYPNCKTDYTNSPEYEYDIVPEKAIMFFTLLSAVFYSLFYYFIGFLCFPIVEILASLSKETIDFKSSGLIYSKLFTQAILILLMLILLNIKTVRNNLKYDFKFNNNKKTLILFLIGVILVGISICFCIVIPEVNNFLTSSYEINRLKIILEQGSLIKYFVFIIVGVLIPIFESYFFRRILHDLYIKFNIIRTIFISLIATSLKLIPFLIDIILENKLFTENINIVASIITIFIPSFISNLIYQKNQNNLAPSLLLHILNNVCFVVLIIFDVL